MKTKQEPLFITENGVEVFSNQEVYDVWKLQGICCLSQNDSRGK
jgi:hypothetical protein